MIATLRRSSRRAVLTLRHSFAAPARRLPEKVEDQPVEPLRLLPLWGVAAVVETFEPAIRNPTDRRLGVTRRKNVVVSAPNQQRGHPQLREPVLNDDAIP